MAKIRQDALFLPKMHFYPKMQNYAKNNVDKPTEQSGSHKTPKITT